MKTVKTKEALLLSLQRSIEVQSKFSKKNSLADKLVAFRNKYSSRVEIVRFCDLRDWKFNDGFMKLEHATGKFFTIDGVAVYTNWPHVKESWSQPIINQPEVGYLGFLSKITDGTLYFLLQAKIEPGNIGEAQFSPTLQATRSNYTRVHNGLSPTYLDLFKNLDKTTVLVDQLQSEQGGRFLRKRNRNMVVLTSEDVEVKEGFTWVTLAELDELIGLDNTLNMDARTVLGNFKLSYINYKHDRFRTEANFAGLKSMSFLADLKSKYDFTVEKVRLDCLEEWSVTSDSIRRADSKYFEVIAVNVEIGGRENMRWGQPMIRPLRPGLCGLLLRRGRDGLECLMQGKFECGNFDAFELGPTVQCLIGGYLDGSSDIPFLSDLTSNSHEVLHDTMQSEEGGRFYKEENRNVIKIVSDDFDPPLSANYIWLSLGELSVLSHFNNYINIQARCLIAAIPWKMLGYE